MLLEQTGSRSCAFTRGVLLVVLVVVSALLRSTAAVGDSTSAGGRASVEARVKAHLQDENDASELSRIFQESLGNNTVGTVGKSHYCQCPKSVATSPLICDTIVGQCKTSFCAPICLSSMAWSPRVRVDCSRAPSWSWCPDFARELMAAAPAIEAQFQAHTCLSDDLCTSPDDPVVSDYLASANDNFRSVLATYVATAARGDFSHASKAAPSLFHTSLDDSLEDTTEIAASDLAPWHKLESWQRANRARVATDAAPHDPDPALPPEDPEHDEAEAGSLVPSLVHLPIGSCSARSPAFRTPTARDMLCEACSEVITVSIAQGSCEPAGAPPMTLINPPRGSLQDRCLFVRDAMAARAATLLRALKSSVCSCAGCCGDRQCWFDNRDAGWGDKAVRSVMKRVSDAERTARATLRSARAAHKAAKQGGKGREKAGAAPAAEKAPAP